MSTEEARFTVNLNEGAKRFHIIVDGLSLGQSSDSAWVDCDYVAIYEVNGQGAESEFEVTAVTWSGIHLNSRDALEQVITAYVMDDPAYSFEQVFPQAQAFKSRVCGEVACSVAGGLNVRSRYYNFANRNIYELDLVTEHAVYYSCYESFMMRSVPEYKLLSDNYFAENALNEELDELAQGKTGAVWMSPSVKEAIEEIRRGN